MLDNLPYRKQRFSHRSGTSFHTIGSGTLPASAALAGEFRRHDVGGRRIRCNDFEDYAWKTAFIDPAESSRHDRNVHARLQPPVNLLKQLEQFPATRFMDHPEIRDAALQMFAECRTRVAIL